MTSAVSNLEVPMPLDHESLKLSKFDTSSTEEGALPVPGLFLGCSWFGGVDGTATKPGCSWAVPGCSWLFLTMFSNFGCSWAVAPARAPGLFPVPPSF